MFLYKLENLYENLKQNQSYSFTATLDDNNKMIYEKNDGNAYTDTIYDGTESKFIIKDGNSYLLIDDQKAYYTYANNDIDLDKIEVQLSEVINSGDYQNGEEKIDGKNYQYEEYNCITDFTMQDTSNVTENQNVKTRFYFKNNKLHIRKTKFSKERYIPIHKSVTEQLCSYHQWIEEKLGLKSSKDPFFYTTGGQKID